MSPTPATPGNPGTPGPPGNPGNPSSFGAAVLHPPGTIPVSAVSIVVNPDRLSRQMLVDTIANWTAICGMAIALALSFTAGGSVAPDLWLVLLVLVGALMATMFWTSARAWRELPYLTMLVEQDPISAESRISALIGRLPMQGPIRLLLYHRLAVLRYRQQRFGETVDLCLALLEQRFGRAAAVRPDLLLMLIDSSLKRGDLWNAYSGLVELSAYPLRLGENIQRVALQTRYEVGAGFDRAALVDLKRKIEMAELLPANQCAGMHLVLAIAARRTGQQTIADWLESRARLMGAPLEQTYG